MTWVFAAVVAALGLWHAAIYVRCAKRAYAQRDLDAAYGDLQELVDAEDLAELMALDGQPAQPAKLPPLGLEGVGQILIWGLLGALIRLVAAEYAGWNAEVCFQSFPTCLLYSFVGGLVAAIACFAVVRRLGGGLLVCALCAALLAVNLSWSSMAGVWLLVALAFCLRSMEQGRSRGGNLVAAAAFVAFAAYLDESSLLFAVGLWLVLLAQAGVLLVQKKSGAKGAMVRAALLFPVSVIGFFVLTLLPGAYVGGATVQTLGVWIVVRTVMGFSVLRPGLRQLLASPDTIVYVAYGLLCAGLLLWEAHRYRQYEALLLCAIACASIVALALGGFSFAPIGSVLLAGAVWARLRSRGAKWQMLLAGGLLFAVGLMMDIVRVL